MREIQNIRFGLSVQIGENLKDHSKYYMFFAFTHWADDVLKGKAR